MSIKWALLVPFSEVYAFGVVLVTTDVQNFPCTCVVHYRSLENQTEALVAKDSFPNILNCRSSQIPCCGPECQLFFPNKAGSGCQRTNNGRTSAAAAFPHIALLPVALHTLCLLTILLLRKRCHRHTYTGTAPIVSKLADCSPATAQLYGHWILV